MKNKKLLYVLIPAVVLIWGALVYKIYARVHTEAPVVSTKAHPVEEMTFNGMDTFSIACNYRDPFLNVPVSTKPSRVKSKDPAQAKAVPTLEKKWPSVFYYGMIKNQHSNKQLVMIQINGTGARMKPGDVLDGIELKKVFKDSIEIGFEKERKIIRKSS